MCETRMDGYIEREILVENGKRTPISVISNVISLFRR